MVSKPPYICSAVPFQKGWIKPPRITSSGSTLHWGGGERGRGNQDC